MMRHRRTRWQLEASGTGQFLTEGQTMAKTECGCGAVKGRWARRMVVGAGLLAVWTGAMAVRHQETERADQPLVTDASWNPGELAMALRGRGGLRRRGTEWVPAADDQAVVETVRMEDLRPDEPQPDETKADEPKPEEPNPGVSQPEESAAKEPTSPAGANENGVLTGAEPAGTPEDAPDAAEGERVTALKPVFTHSAAMTEIHNQYRAEMGLPAQAVDEDLSRIAQGWAEHMASVGSMYHGGGEQIIAYSGGDCTYDKGFRLWLGSPPHRAWLCSRGNLCGFGYALGRNGCAYYAGAFGSSPVVVQAGSDESSDAVYTASYSQGRDVRQARRARRR